MFWSGSFYWPVSALHHSAEGHLRDGTLTLCSLLSGNNPFLDSVISVSFLLSLEMIIIQNFIWYHIFYFKALFEFFPTFWPLYEVSPSIHLCHQIFSPRSFCILEFKFDGSNISEHVFVNHFLNHFSSASLLILQVIFIDWWALWQLIYTGRLYWNKKHRIAK